MIDEAIQLLRAALPSTVELRSVLPGRDVWLEGDPTKVHQVLMNLCTNASHAMNERGAITIAVEDLEVSAKFCETRPGLARGPYVRLRVTDSGCGMNEATRHRIFEPYFTTKDREKGTGLGLAVVHGIALHMGGDIEVESKVGEGSTFILHFPLAKAPVPRLMVEKKARQKGRETILVVDDETLICNVVRHGLERLGYHVEVCTDPIAALESVAEYPDLHDLVLTDLTMPGMTGLELAAAILHTCAEKPIVLWSGHMSRNLTDQANAAGIAAVVGKPLRPSELAETVRRVLDSRSAAPTMVPLEMSVMRPYTV